MAVALVAPAVALVAALAVVVMAVAVAAPVPVVAVAVAVAAVAVVAAVVAASKITMPPTTPDSAPSSSNPAPVGAPPPISRGKLILVFVSLLVLLLMVVGGYFFFIKPMMNTQKLVEEQTQSIETARQLIAQDREDAAIPLLEGVVKDTANVNVAALANLNLGNAYIVADREEKGIALLKQVSLDQAYPPWVRSLAVENIVGYFFASGARNSVAQSVIFTGPQWSSFVSGVPAGSIGYARAAREALVWGEEIHPLVNIEYRLAHWYAQRLHLYRADQPMYSLYLSSAQKYLAKGDKEYTAVQDTIEESTFPMNNFMRGSALMLKARTLRALYGEKVSGITETMVTDAFNQSLVYFEKGNSSRSITSAFSARFFLAAFLNDTNSSLYKSDIISTLTPLYNQSLATSTSFTKLLRAYSVNTESRQSKQGRDMVNLAETDPRFKDLLISLGWKESYLD